MKWLKTLVVIATLMTIQQTQASYQFFDNQKDFDKMMSVYYGPESASINSSLGEIEFFADSLTKIGVSGFSGKFSGGIVNITLSDDNVIIPDIDPGIDGFVGFITGDPLSLFIESVKYQGTLTDLVYGMDIVAPVPEPSTYLAGIGALGILAMSFRRKAV